MAHNLFTDAQSVRDSPFDFDLFLQERKSFGSDHDETRRDRTGQDRTMQNTLRHRMTRKYTFASNECTILQSFRSAQMGG